MQLLWWTGRNSKTCHLTTTVSAWATLTKGTEWLTYLSSQRTWEWTKELFFQHLNRIQNSYIIVTLRQQNGTQNTIWLWFKICWKWLQESLIFSLFQEEDHAHKSVKWHTLKPNTLRIDQLAVSCVQPRTTLKLQCSKCKVNLHVEPCFRIYHEKVNFWIRLPTQHDSISRNKCWTCQYYNILLYFMNGWTFFGKDNFY
jgi:hypothetical protein